MTIPQKIIGTGITEFPGASFNALVDVAERVNAAGPGIPPLPYPQDETYLRTISAKVSNSRTLKRGLGAVPYFKGFSGDAFTRGSFYPASGATIDQAQVHIPDGTSVGQAGPFWICLSKESDDYGTFVVSGPTWGWVDVRKTWHSRVSLHSWSSMAIDAGLATDVTGYPIIWKPTGTGYQWVLIDVGSQLNNYEYEVQLPTSPVEYGVYPVGGGNLNSYNESQIPTRRRNVLTLSTTAADYDKVRRFVFVGGVPTSNPQSWAHAAMDGVVVCNKSGSMTVGDVVGPTSTDGANGLSTNGSGWVYLGDVTGESTLAYFSSLDMIETTIGSPFTGPIKTHGMVKGTADVNHGDSTFTLTVTSVVYGSDPGASITVDNSIPLDTGGTITVYAIRDDTASAGWSSAVAANTHAALKGLPLWGTLQTATDPEILSYNSTAEQVEWKSFQASLRGLSGWDESKDQVLADDNGSYLWNEGFKGPPGNDGDEGPPGPDGDKGIDGPKGEKGADGQDGPAGDQGDRGNQGAEGIAGAPGAKGPPGLPGFPGSDGQDGKWKIHIDPSRIDHVQFVEDFTALVWTVSSTAIKLKLEYKQKTGSFVDWDTIYDLDNLTPWSAATGEECPLPAVVPV